EAKAAWIRQWTRRHGYWSRPEVVARRHAYRSQIEIQARDREYNRDYYQANKDASRERARRRYALKRESTTVPFTQVELDQRLSMSRGRCWICKKRVDGDYHVDHVKPLNKGGPHMLANLRLACAPCN